MFHLILSVLLATLIGCSHTPAVTDPSHPHVVKIHDGDTITVVSQGMSQRVRLAGIDCPETDQPYGAEATEATKSLALNRDVTVTPVTTDRYGRTVAEVNLQDGRSLTHELVKAGACWWYRKYAPSDAELERLETEARKQHRGVWATDQPMPPWEWRAQRLDAQTTYPSSSNGP